MTGQTNHLWLVNDILHGNRMPDQGSAEPTGLINATPESGDRSQRVITGHPALISHQGGGGSKVQRAQGA